MATVVYADLNTIQDEDILRRMWANTEDFGRKKEIRARMYKLREQRLKDFYTTGDVSDMNRKHQQLPRHADSLEDQGFMTMKSKEIRDSESPTRDMSRRKGNGYWDSRQETVYSRGKEEDANVEVKYVSTEGRGVVKEPDMEKKMAYQTESAQESTWKQDNNSFMMAEAQKKLSQSASVAKGDNTEERTFAQNEEFSNFKTMTEQNESISSVSNVSASTSSRQVISSSYQTTSDSNQDDKVVVIDDSGTNARPFVELTSDSTGDFTDYDVQTESCTNQQKRETTSKTSTTNQSLKQVFSTQTLDDSVQLDLTNFRVRGEDVDVGENVKVTEYRTITDNQSRKDDQTNEQLYRNYEVEKSQDRSLEQTVDASTLRDSSKKEEYRSVRSDDFVTAEQTQRKTSRTDSSSRHETTVNEKAVTEQKILNEIQKLDSYLSTHTPAPSTPASPPCEPDGGWTLVSDKGGEFVYHERSEPDGKKSAVPSHAAGKKSTPHSSMDLPTSATDGQYMTTYQQSYNKISVDHTPSHEFFVKTLRSSPERSTPSPTKRDYTSSSSRSSPERRKLSNSKSSLEKNSADHRRRTDTKSPEYYENKQRSSPSKSPVQKKKQITHHNESTTGARKHSETRITTKETKSKRKFSSTKERAANRNRVATPGASPSTSPVHKKTGKETSDSDSDASQATYDCTKKSEVITESRTNVTTIRKKDKKDQSPELSSEGSITRELKKKKQTTPEPSAFAPIKQLKTTPQDFTRTDKDQLKHTKSNKLTVENVRKHKENDYLPTGGTENFVNEERNETKLVRHENRNVRTTKASVNTVHDIREVKENVLRQRDVQTDIVKDDTDIKNDEDLTFERQPTSKTTGVLSEPSETLVSEEKREICIENTNLTSPEKKQRIDFDPSVAKMNKAPFASPENQNPENRSDRQPSVTTPERHHPGTDRLHPERSPDRKQPGTDHQHLARTPDHKHLSTDRQHPERSPERHHPGTDRQHPERSHDLNQSGTDRQHPERSPDRKHPSTDRQYPENRSDRHHPGIDRPHSETSPERHHPGTDRQHPERSHDLKQPGTDRQHPERSPERHQPDTECQYPERSSERHHPSADCQFPEKSPERHHPGIDRPHSEMSPERHHPGTDRQHPERSSERQYTGTDRPHSETSPERHRYSTDRQQHEMSPDRKQPGTDHEHPERSPDHKLPSTDGHHPERSPQRHHSGTDRQFPEKSPERQQPDTGHQYPERSPDHKHLSSDRQHPDRSPERHHPGTDRQHPERSHDHKQPGTDRQHYERSPDRKHPSTDRQHPERSPDRKHPSTDRQHHERSPDRKHPSTDRSYPENRSDRQYPERSQSPVKKSAQETSLKKMKTSDEKTERRDSSNRSTKTKETTTLARQENFPVTRRNTQKPICNDSKPRNTSNVPLVKKPIVASKHFTPERKSTVLKHTTKVVTSSRLEQNTSESPSRRHPESPTDVQRKTAQSRQLIQARKVPTSSHRPQTTQPTTKKTTNVSPSTLSKTTSTSIQETTKLLLGRKREDTTTKKRPSFEGGKTESPKPKVSPSRSIPQKSKLVDTDSRPTQKPQTETFNKPQRRVVPSQVKLQSKDTGKTAIVTTRETHRMETQNFLKNEAKSVSDLEDETPPAEFYGDLDDEFDSSVQKGLSSTSSTQVKVQHDVYYNAKKDQTHELDSRNSSALSMEEDSPTKPKSQPYKKEPSLKANVNQDLLNVVVQHPKSSRESSPGYSSTADNFAVTTSDDGESNPRYADFVSEPEDVEVFDKLTGPSGPIPYSDRFADDFGDENDVPKSVAEKVSVFLNEAKKSLETKVTGNQVLIDNSNSVSKAKTLFEKVAKTENDEKKHHLLEDFVDHPGKKTKTDSSYHETHKVIEHDDDTAEGEFDHAVNRLPLETSNETDYRQELKETTKSSRKDTPVPKPPGKTFLRNENRKFIEKESIGAKTDVSTKKSFFENKAEEQKHPRKPKQEPSSYAKDTQASTVRSRSPDKVHSNEQRRKSSLTEDVSALERRQFKSEVTVKTITKLHEPTSSFDRNDSDKSISSRRSSKPGESTPSLPQYHENTKQPERRGSSPTKGYNAEKNIGSPKLTKHYETTEKYESHTTTQNAYDTPRKTGPQVTFPTKSYETSTKTAHTTDSQFGTYGSPRSAEPHALRPQSYVTSRKIEHTYPHSGEVDSPRNAEPTASSPKSYEMSTETEYTTSTHSTQHDSPRNSEPHASTLKSYDSARTTVTYSTKLDSNRKTEPRAPSPSKSYDKPWKSEPRATSPPKSYDSPRKSEPHPSSTPKSYDKPWKSQPRATSPPKSYDSPRKSEPHPSSTPKSYDKPWKSEPRATSPPKSYDSPRKSEPHPSSTPKSYDKPWKSEPRATSPPKSYDSPRKSEPRSPSPPKSYDRPWKSEPRATSPPKSYDSPRKSEPRSPSPPKSYDRPWKSEPRASSPPKFYDSSRKPEPRSSSPPRSYDRPWKSEPRASSPPKFYDSSRKPETRSSSPPKSYDSPRKSEPRASSPPKFYDSSRKPEPRSSSPPKSYDSPKKSEPRASSPSKLGTKSHESSLKTENVGEHTVRSHVKTSDSVLQRTAKPENDVKTLPKSLNNSTIFKQNESVLQKTKTEEKFGVQLRKTPSANKFDTVTVRLKSSTSEAPAIENIYDLELLEQMLVKAEAYEERRRIRAQIRLVKKELEEQHNSITRSTSVQTRTHEVSSHTSSNRDNHTSKRSVKESSPEPKMTSLTKSSYNTRVQNKEEDKEKTVPKRSYSERPKSTHSPDHTSVKNVTTTTTIREKSDSFSRLSPEERTVCTYEVTSKPVDSSFLFQKSTDSPQPEKSSNLKKTTYEQRKTTTTSTTTTNSVTDPITSSYGMGPIDEHGKPLFGLRALRRTHQDQTPAGDDLARTETVTYNTYTLTTSDFDEPASLASLKTMSKADREFSGPEIVEVSNDDSAYSEDTRRRTSKEYTVEEVSDLDGYLSTGLKSENIKRFTSHLQNLEDSQAETRHEEETRRPLVRGDSVKALQHKYQQATEAANQTCGGCSYPKAGLILRSNSLQHSDDPNQSSSSMRKTKTETVETTRRVLHSSYGGGVGDKQVVVKAQMSEQVEDSSGIKSARQVQGVKAMTTTMTKDGHVEKSSSAVRVTTSGGGTSSTTTTTSFLDNNSKVTGVQDILSRMRNADLVTETDDTEEDAKARALLNKFLGASVILQGMEQGMRHSANQQKSAALVGEVDKQLVKATTRTREENIEEICDKDQLKFLLDSCSDLEEKRKLRARLREVMAEDKGGVGEAKGTLSDVPGPVERTGIWPSNKSSNVDDSGTESGEDLRMINPEIMQEVQTALSRLEGVIPVLDPTKRNAVTQLVSSLQCCLKINKDQQLAPPTPPMRKFGNKRSLKNRHTVGVTREELVEARMWADECGLNRTMTADDINTGSSSFLENVFRPVRFVPPPVVEEKIPISRYTKLPLLKVAYEKPILYKIGFFMEPAPQNGSVSYFEPDPKLSYERSLSDSGSLCDYDPSLGLFTPKQTVQIAVHKAAINKQISCRESITVQGRGSSEDGDVSSTDEDKHELSSVHRLLQLASESNSKPKFTGKKQKMKRANTIDIPKRSTIFDYSSDDHGASADEQNRKGSDDMGHLGKKERPPSFEPKTENDHKFLSFLQRVSESEGSKMPAYNPSARGGKHWRNRFSTIKTTFESKDITPPKNTFSPSPAKLFWQKSENQSLNAIKTNSNSGKLPWSVKTQEDGVIVGSLTVAKPSIVNNFNHAPKSAFKPIEKKPTTPLISPASGTVKQIAAMKFSTFETPILQKPKPLNMKTYASNTEKDKSKFLAGNNNNSNVTHKFYNIPSNVVSQEVKQKVQEKHVVNNQINNQLAKPKYKKLDPVENTSYVEKNYFYHGQPKKSTGQKEMLKSQPPFLSQVGNQDYPTSPSKSSGPAPFANSINSPTLACLPRSVLSEPKRREIIPQFMEDFEKSYQSDRPNRYCEYASRPKEPRNKLPNTFYNDEESNAKPHHLSYPNKPDVKADEENVNQNKNSRQSLICEEKDRLKFMDNTNFSNDFSHPVTVTAPKLNGYSNFTTTESNTPMNSTNFVREDKLQDNQNYLCNLRDASTIDTNREYVSNIPVTTTILKNGQYISITPKSRTPTMDGDGVNEFIKQSPNTSGGRSPINRTSPPSSDGSSNNGGRVYYNNTQMRLSNKIEDMSQMENYVNARLAPNSALTPHNLPIVTPDRVSPLRNWAPSGSPSIKVEKVSDPGNGGDCYEEKAVSRVMGQAQCQVAVSVSNRNRTRYDDSKNIQSELRLQVQQSARQKSLSPTNFPNVLQKSESWHQMVKEKMNLAKQAPPLPKLSKAKSSHSLALPRQFESAISPETVENKKMTVSQYLSKQSQNREQRRNTHKASKSMLDIDDLENVDEVFESIFQEASIKRNTKRK